MEIEVDWSGMAVGGSDELHAGKILVSWFKCPCQIVLVCMKVTTLLPLFWLKAIHLPKNS